jgi:hypothetical protein
MMYVIHKSFLCIEAKAVPVLSEKFFLQFLHPYRCIPFNLPFAKIDPLSQ